MQLGAYVDSFQADPKGSGFILDFDGTLSPIVAEPDDAVVLDGVPELLEQLALKYGVVALVSGRRAKQLSEKVNVPSLRYIGLYGAEEMIAGILVQPAEALHYRQMASHLADAAQTLIESEGWEGCQVEYKEMAVSVHYRNARQPEVARDGLMSWARRATPPLGFIASQGRMVVELRPIGVSKADAFERVVDDARLVKAVLAGDDSSDLEAMIRAREKMGEEVLVIGVSSNEAPEGMDQYCDLQVSSSVDLAELLRVFL